MPKINLEIPDDLAESLRRMGKLNPEGVLEIILEELHRRTNASKQKEGSAP